MAQAEQSPLNRIKFGRRGFLELVAAGSVALKDGKSEVVSAQDYCPVTDKQATLDRLSQIKNGKREATPREMFEAIADTYASSFDPDRLKENDEALFRIGENNIFATYYKVAPGFPEKELSYVTVASIDTDWTKGVGFRRLGSGNIQTVRFDTHTEDDYISTMSPGEGQDIAQLLFESLQTPNLNNLPDISEVKVF